MTFASIMVSVDLASDASGQIGISAHLADAFDGRTIGVAAQSPKRPAAQVGPMGASAILPVLSRQAVVEGLARAEELFRTTVGNRSQVSWRAAPEPGLAFLASQARAADLVVGQGRSDGATGCPDPLDPASVVLATGRPVLVVPPGIDYLESRRVLVAWKDTREARRAVMDAIPILRLAGSTSSRSRSDGRGPVPRTSQPIWRHMGCRRHPPTIRWRARATPKHCSTWPASARRT